MPDPNDKRTDKAPGAQRGHLVSQDWPAYRFGPDGQGVVFQSAADVPAGWADHPSKSNPDAVAANASLEERAADVVRREKLISHEILALEEREVAVEQREALCDQRETALDEHEASLTAPPPPVPEKTKGRGKKIVIEADDVDDSADDADED